MIKFSHILIAEQMRKYFFRIKRTLAPFLFWNLTYKHAWGSTESMEIDPLQKEQIKVSKYDWDAFHIVWPMR